MSEVIVTGASGFIGSHVLAAARARGLDARGISRRGDDGSGGVALDLTSDVDSISRVLRGASAVVHCAASLSGPADVQLRDTVQATRNLVAAMEGAGVPRLVLLSSISVYDFHAIPAWSDLTEASPTEALPGDRGPYIEAKLAQETIVRAAAPGIIASILRPGLVYGRGRTDFYDLHPLRLGPLGVVLVPEGPAPLCDVQACAEAAISAIGVAAAEGPVFNLVDDQLPTRGEFLAMARTPSIPLHLSWRALQLATLPARWAGVTHGMLHPRRLAARCKPLRYPNHRAREVLQWRGPDPSRLRAALS